MQSNSNLTSTSAPSPETFLWGVATSGYQSEGGFNGPNEPKNNWFQGERWGNVMPTGPAAEFWTRYEEDFQRCQTMGLNSFRLGLEWTRIQPSAHAGSGPAPAFDLDALDAYSDRIAACRQRGLEPIVTLHHFTHPAWLGMDAWLSEDTVDCFAEYVRVAVTHINRRLTEHYKLAPIHWYITVNEPNMLVLNTYLSRQFPAGAAWGIGAVLHAYSHMLAAHVRAYNCIHDIYEANGWKTPRVSLNTYCSDNYWSEKVIWDLLSLRQGEVKLTELKDYADANANQLKVALRRANLPFKHDLPYKFGQWVYRFSNWFARRNFDIQHLNYFFKNWKRLLAHGYLILWRSTTTTLLRLISCDYRRFRILSSKRRTFAVG